MNRRISTTKVATLAAAVIAQLQFSGAAYSQTAPRERSSQLEEIVVTARRTSESLMDVPVAISVMTAENIEATNVQNVIELSRFTPGLFANVSGNGRVDRSRTTLNFRGLSVAAGLFFIDGAPYAGTNTPDVTDVERVEVLKGPQSAYFGRSTFAGAVNFVTQSPSETFEGRVTAEGTSFDGSDVSVMVQGPLSDTVGARFRARHYSFGGYYPNGDSGSRMGEQETTSFTLTLEATPTDRLKIRTLLSYTEDDDGVPNTAALKSGQEIFCDLGGADGGGAYYCGELPTMAGIDPAILSVNDYVDPLTYSEIIDNDKEYPLTFDPTYKDSYGFRRETAVAHLNLDYEFDSGFTLQTITAYHYTKTGSINDQVYRDGRSTPNPFFGIIPFASEDRKFALQLQSVVNDFSQEIRLTSPQEARLRYTVGANYFKQWGPASSNSGHFFAGRHTGTSTKTSVDTPAIFGGLYYDLTDRLTLGVEGRYQWDKIEEQAIFPNFGEPLKETFTSFSPRVTLDYNYSDKGLVYGLYSKGFQPGGFNTSLVNQPQSIIDQIAVAGGNIAYDQEELDNFEIGVKTTWLDNRLRTTLAAYYSEWSEGQVVNEVFVTRPDGTLLATSVTTNVGEIELKGIEFESVFAATSNLTLSGTVNFADNEIKTFNYIPGGIRIQNDSNVDGNFLQKTPEWSWSLSADYVNQLTETYDWYTRVDYTGNSKIFVDPTNVAWIGGSERVNFRVGLRSDNLTVSAFVENLFDNDTLQEATRANDVFFSFSRLNEIRLGLPDRRTLGVRATYTF